MKFETFIVGKYVDLVLLDEKVVKKTDWYTWLNHQKNTKMLETGKFPNTLEKQITYLNSDLSSKKEILSLAKLDKKLQLGVVEKNNNTLVGMVSAYDFDYFNKVCYISVITDLRKQNINRLQVFKESQDLLIDHIFFKMNFRKIYSGAKEKGLSDMTKKIWGFKLQGVLKKHTYVDGKYLDSYLVGLFKKDWIKLRGDKSKKSQ
jgi:diamine N-acetyltransferase